MRKIKLIFGFYGAIDVAIPIALNYFAARAMDVVMVALLRYALTLPINSGYPRSVKDIVFVLLMLIISAGLVTYAKYENTFFLYTAVVCFCSLMHLFLSFLGSGFKK